MTDIEYRELYFTNKEVKGYVDRCAKSNRTTMETVIRWAIVKYKIDDIIKGGK